MQVKKTTKKQANVEMKACAGYYSNKWKRNQGVYDVLLQRQRQFLLHMGLVSLTQVKPGLSLKFLCRGFLYKTTLGLSLGTCVILDHGLN